MSKNELQYYVRKSWNDVESQVGIPYNFLVNAKKACDKLIGYSVFDTNGNLIYPKENKEEIKEEKSTMIFNIGDTISLLPGAQYIDGSAIKDWVFNTKLYIRNIEKDTVTISNVKNGLVLGTVSIEFVVPYTEEAMATFNSTEAYPVVVINNTVIKNGAGIHHTTINKAKKFSIFTIVAEKDNWGKLQNHPGWIDLNEVKRIV